MLVFSHRGYHVTAPENTIEAFDQALRFGVDGIETDLRLSADGQIVLFHDRLVPDGREVSRLTRDEIAAAVNHPVPTLDEALSRFDGLTWNLELKVPEVVEGVLDAIARYASASRRFLLTSFWHPAIESCQGRILDQPRLARRTEVQLGLLTADRPLDVQFVLTLTEVAQLPNFRVLVWYFDVLDPPLVEQARDQDLMNFAYGLKTAADHRRCAELGLEGIITDRPDLMAQVRHG
jgi:glycerophosphoryl diester phosphodiesterase